MMLPGEHNINVKVGYYTQVLGLGLYPNDTSIDEFSSPNGDTNFGVGALNNFWRSVENVKLLNANGS